MFTEQRPSVPSNHHSYFPPRCFTGLPTYRERNEVVQSRDANQQNVASQACRRVACSSLQLGEPVHSRQPLTLLSRKSEPPVRSFTMSRPRHHLFARHSSPPYSPLRVFAPPSHPPPIFSLGVSPDHPDSTSLCAYFSTPPASSYAPFWPAVSLQRAGTIPSGRRRVRPGSGTAACRRSWRGGGCGRRRSW
jgi:hypothetical protein